MTLQLGLGGEELATELAGEGALRLPEVLRGDVVLQGSGEAESGCTVQAPEWLRPWRRETEGMGCGRHGCKKQEQGEGRGGSDEDRGRRQIRCCGTEASPSHSFSSTGCRLNLPLLKPVIHSPACNDADDTMFHHSGQQMLTTLEWLQCHLRVLWVRWQPVTTVNDCARRTWKPDEVRQQEPQNACLGLGRKPLRHRSLGTVEVGCMSLTDRNPKV